MPKTVVHITGLLFLLLVSALTGFLLVKNLDPAEARIWHKVLLYSAIFVSVFTLTNLIGFRVRRALLLGLLGVTVLLFSAASIFTPWNAALVLAVFMLIELYAISR